MVNPVYTSGTGLGLEQRLGLVSREQLLRRRFLGLDGDRRDVRRGAAIFGSIVNSSDQQTYTSYQVQPNSPGATLLSNYELTQVQCGPPGLVVIYGPNNSVICANPNNTVRAGEYDLDTEQLSLVSR